jgi:tRNA-intron endonuclease
MADEEIKEEKAIGVLVKDKVVISSEPDANRIFNKGWYGKLVKAKLELSLVEALYLKEKGKIDIKLMTGKKLSYDSFMKLAIKEEKRFPVRYAVYSDIRERGYITKTALKYGADFRVYPRGENPDSEHAKWVLFCVREGESYAWRGFAAMMRVAHSVRKTLLIGIADDEGDVTYYEVNWTRP